MSEDKTYVALWANYDIDGKDNKKRVEGRGFKNQAYLEANGRRAQYYSFPFEYKTGEEFIRAFTEAYEISSGLDIDGTHIHRRIHLVNIFGHGGGYGLTSPYDGLQGIYSSHVNPLGGGRHITDIRADIFATDAVIVIHNCYTSLYFAPEFLQHLVNNGKTDVKVIAHRDAPGASFNISWYEHTVVTPGGVQRGPLERKYWLHPSYPNKK